MKKFWELLQESVITQAAVTVMVVGAVIYLSVTGKPIPDLLNSITGLVVGFYFGSKLALRQARFGKDD